MAEGGKGRSKITVARRSTGRRAPWDAEAEQRPPSRATPFVGYASRGFDLSRF